ncbi:hypothetical protein B0E52_07400 [Rhodanobacter sp. C06]|uniref:hypothetical protein n=1 Tax=Rhodanobacter sp. C06 TaxID=1945854 RepID=UPI000985AB6A|nr:hypothetical protein [Rhodanobacter sp. C06]OOG44560.1 hypothetical protein B0E52_07400 [Rhodanobacter sp. C06]
MKTTLYTVLCVAVRLGAVLMAVGLFERLPVFLWQSPEGGFALDAVLLAVFGLLVAGALWLWPGILAGWAIGRRGHESLEVGLSADTLLTVALAVTGAVLVVSGVAGCLGHGLTMLFFRSRLADQSTGLLPVTEWHWLIFYLVQTAGGLALMLGAHGLASLMWRLRAYPIRSEADSDDGITPRD